MLSYQHIYHAGNLADVQKHLWLITVLDYLTKKDKPFLWLDTHAGRGLYDLSSDEAQKVKEYESGILKYYADWKDDKDLPIALTRYCDFIQRLNKDALIRYPGSAYLTMKIMRPTDKLYAFDLHKGEFAHLQKTLQPYLNSDARFEDGFIGLKSLIPHTTIKRGGVLIDPSYETKGEYTKTAQAVIDAYAKWPQGIYMIWYPILDKGDHTQITTMLSDLNLPDEKIAIDEWHFGEVERGMKGTGIAIINPPYGAVDSMAEIKTLLKL